MPALKTNQDGLRKVLDDLVKQYKTKQDDLEKWKVRLNTGSLTQKQILTFVVQKKNNVQVVQQ